MNNYADKTEKSKVSSTSSAHTQRVSKKTSVFQFVDNRPEAAVQRKIQAAMDRYSERQQLPIQRKNNTGLPNNLKSGIENLSGYTMDDVKVHYNSDKPAQLNAHAYAQGTNIHLASGQEKHLPHEAWHVVQQKQGRVQPTLQMKGKVNVNDDEGLEKEADIMGEKALQMKQQEFQNRNETLKNTTLKNDIHQEIQLEKITNLKDSKEYTFVNDGSKTTLFDGENEVGSVTFETAFQGGIAQGYIKVESDYSRQGLSYLIIKAALEQYPSNWVVFLSGGSLSTSGTGLKNALGMERYTPSADGAQASGPNWCQRLFSCFTSSTVSDEEQQLLSSDGYKAEAYKYEVNARGGPVDFIYLLTVREIRTKIAAKGY